VIQVKIDEHDPMGQFILHKAQQMGQSPEEIAIGIAHETFENIVRGLHKRFINGEITQGVFADMLGIERIDLIHLLDELGLRATNV
jgi:hypothetical protein